MLSQSERKKRARRHKVPREPKVIPRLTRQELAQFVLDYCDGAIFTMADVRREADIPLVFMPVAMGAFAEWTRAELAMIGTIYEQHSRALPRGINGQPMFTSFKLIHVEDFKVACAAIDRELHRRKTSVLDDL